MDDKDIEQAIKHLDGQHRKLDIKIEELQREPVPDLLTIQRHKREKLRIKDEIAKLRAMQLPDNIA